MQSEKAAFFVEKTCSNVDYFNKNTIFIAKRVTTKYSYEN